MSRTATTNTILDRIVADKREELAALVAAEPLERLKERALAAQAPTPFAAALRGPQLRLIAEIKKASPSKGILDGAVEPLVRAREYMRGGAAAISVLTERRHFLGDLEHVSAVRDGLNEAFPGTRPPLLRKDFLFDPYHLYEARAAGADAVLLIAAVLPDGALQELQALAAELGLETLVEVHDEEELERVLRTGARVIGINNRDLRTFVTEVAVTERLRPLIPEDRIVVSESGIHTREDATRVRALGVDAVLVGEALMTSGDVVGRMKELIV